MMNGAGRRAVIGGLVSALAIAPVGARGAALRAGEVETARGECFARAGTGRRSLARDAAVFVGDYVGTGADSSLGMLLGTATTVRLGPEAQLRIDRFIVGAGGVLTLDRGGILYDHDPQAGEDATAVRAPFGLMAVRGTRFFAGPSNGVFGVFVERGAVFVVGVYTAVTVTAGLGTNITTQGAEPTLPAVWQPPRISAAMAQFRQ